MKENYFKKNNIKKKSYNIIKSIKINKSLKDLKFIPSKSALLVLDMQDYFLKSISHAYIPSAEIIIPEINELIECYNRRNFPVIFTRHINSSEDAGMMKVWWKNLIRKEDKLSNISSKINSSMGNILVKNQYDAFYNTDLDLILKKNGIEQIVICGVMTNLCCESTARSGFIHGYQVFFMVDGTATYNFDYHKFSINNLAFGFAVPKLCENIIRILNEK